MRRFTFYFLLCLLAVCAGMLIYHLTEPSSPSSSSTSSFLSSTQLALLYPLPSTPSTFLASLASLLTSTDPSLAASPSSCSTIPYCPLIASTLCGWCWDDSSARPGGHRGDVGGQCQDWTWQANQCALHVQCEEVVNCQGIVGTTCGWCEGGRGGSAGGLRGGGSRRGMRGGVKGPAWEPCDGQWTFDYRQCPTSPLPQQLHLMYGTNPTVMVITWSSSTNSSSIARWEEEGGGKHGTAVGVVAQFAENNAAGLQWVHRANMTGLTPSMRYRYHVENDGHRSRNFSFSTLPPTSPPSSSSSSPSSSSSSSSSSVSTPPPSSPRFIVYGDMGRFGGAPALSAVEREVFASFNSTSPVTAILHLGDFAYDLMDYGGVNGDAFMARIEPIAAVLPYLTTPGNHETEDGRYAHYRNRFTMPGSWTEEGWRMWWSLDIGLIHFVSYSTEALFSYGDGDTGVQMDWLRADLERANERRDVQPWVVAFGHRPMYCSNNDGDDCTTDDGLVRRTFERLFDDMGVDLVLEAHEHSYHTHTHAHHHTPHIRATMTHILPPLLTPLLSHPVPPPLSPSPHRYERLWPVFDTVTLQKDYIEPMGMVHVITGTAGCNEQAGACINAIPGPRGEWSALHSANRLMYGYGHLLAVNSSHLYWDEVLVEEGGAQLDAVWIVQHQHGNFSRRREQAGWTRQGGWGSSARSAEQRAGEQHAKGTQVEARKPHLSSHTQVPTRSDM